MKDDLEDDFEAQELPKDRRSRSTIAILAVAFFLLVGYVFIYPIAVFSLPENFPTGLENAVEATCAPLQLLYESAGPYEKYIDFLQGVFL